MVKDFLQKHPPITWPASMLASQQFILFISIFCFMLLWIFIPHIAGSRNLDNLSSNLWPLLVLVIGQMFVLIVGGIDLSQTSVMAVTSVVGAAVLTSGVEESLFSKSPLWGWWLTGQGSPVGDSSLAIPLAIVLMLILGAAIGYVNGIAVTKFSMPPFMVTLVSMMFFSGLAIYLTKSENIIHLPDGFIQIGRGGFRFFPVSFFVVFCFGAASHFVLNRTVLGRWFYAVGKNARAAKISGVPTEKVILMAYVFSGFCAAAASILYSARLEGGRPTLGQNLLLDIIGAAVIGGISLFGGEGNVRRALYGALFFTLLANALNMLNLSFFVIYLVKGAVILIAAMLDISRLRLLQGLNNRNPC